MKTSWRDFVKTAGGNLDKPRLWFNPELGRYQTTPPPVKMPASRPKLDFDRFSDRAKKHPLINFLAFADYYGVTNSEGRVSKDRFRDCLKSYLSGPNVWGVRIPKCEFPVYKSTDVSK